VASGALVLGEHITWNEPVGAALVLFGAAVAQGLIRPRSLSRD
jgi:drug/metabolite transporter (DMT)-like permease